MKFAHNEFLTSLLCRGSECVELYLLSPILLQGLVLIISHRDISSWRCE